MKLHENINLEVQMYSYILSEILLGKHSPHHSREVKESIVKVNGFILKYPEMACYKTLRKELAHLEALIMFSD
jgi:hypothetical protein